MRPARIRDKNMAYLVKCSLCGRDVSSECKACPGCGHNVANELCQKKVEEERIQRENWKKEGLCEKCGNSVFQKAFEIKDYSRFGEEVWERVYAKCTKCGWDDRDENYEQTCTIGASAWSKSRVYEGQHKIGGYGLKNFGKRIII